MMEIKTIPVGQYQANAYLLIQDEFVCMIDPGAKAEKLIAAVPEGSKFLGILLTHGHFDHIGAVDDVVKYFNCPVYASHLERDIYMNPETNYSTTKKVSIQAVVTDFTHHLDLGPFHFSVHETPGHTQGSVCLQIDNHLFTGDTLFKQGIGRTDLFSGNAQDMKRTLQYLKTLSSHLIIYPGHDGSSTLAQEFMTNPYFKR